MLAIALALTLEPLRKRVQSLADRTLFRRQKAFDETLSTFTNQLGSAPDLPAIVRTAHEAAISLVDPASTHVFLYDELNGQFTAFRSEGRGASREIRFAGHGPLAAYLLERRVPLQIDESALPAELQPIGGERPVYVQCVDAVHQDTTRRRVPSVPSVQGISDAGHIAGHGSRSDGSHIAYLLTPVW